MSDLSSRERRKLEQLFGMRSGWALDFSNPSFNEFFTEYVGRNIDDPRYLSLGTSKANRLRSFWAQEPNWLAAKSIKALLEHAADARILGDDPELIGQCEEIVTRLTAAQPVADIDAISGTGEERDFDAVARAARDSIDNNQPEAGLDRLHTFVIKFVRMLCDARGLAATKDIPLNGLIGAYVKKLGDQGHLGSEMTARILKSSVGNLEAFNHVRNKHSMAHDNPILSYDEALLIFNHVASAVRFIKSLEKELADEAVAAERAAAHAPFDLDIPF